jgi:hypothetical protein
MTVNRAKDFSSFSACGIIAEPMPEGSPKVMPTLILEDFNVGLIFELI